MSARTVMQQTLAHAKLFGRPACTFSLCAINGTSARRSCMKRRTARGAGTGREILCVSGAMHKIEAPPRPTGAEGRKQARVCSLYE